MDGTLHSHLFFKTMIFFVSLPIQANISSTNSLHPKREHIYAVEEEANHHTPTSISLSSQSFAQKVNSTPAYHHNHPAQQRPPRPPPAVINRNSELTSVVIHHQESLRRSGKGVSKGIIIEAKDDNEDVIVIPQNGLRHFDKLASASSASAAAQQRRLSESDVILVFPQKKQQPPSIASVEVSEASSKSEVCLSQAVKMEDAVEEATNPKKKTKSLEHIRII